MAAHNELGKVGEEMAKNHLLQNGYKILATNWRTGRAELDIIAKQDDILVFVEVKTRSDNRHGEPEAFVTEEKKNFMRGAAGVYMELINHNWEIRFDVISVFVRPQKSYLKHIVDAFW